MKTLKNLKSPWLSILFFCLFFLFISTPIFADNIMDSDLSNRAGTNKNWQNSFWFLVCIGLLIIVAVAGYAKKYINVRRDYDPDHK